MTPDRVGAALRKGLTASSAWVREQSPLFWVLTISCLANVVTAAIALQMLDRTHDVNVVYTVDARLENQPIRVEVTRMPR